MAGLVMRTCIPRRIAYSAMGKWVLSGVKIVMAEPGLSASMAVLYASGSTLSSAGKESKDTSSSLYTLEMFFCRWFSI